ncbi:J domain-containing protein [Mycolicibacter sinensis]|uniref:J domain-containing protein n=1 Tax=Mycolicibacter sinensis (strain JDM601) TaxID=875328 RepID=UPI0009ED47D7|nr:J domain-containing protein [Mycolicibacter sinensis]
MSESFDPYDVLGVMSSATPAQISHAFRTKVRALHPDTGSARSQLSDDVAAQLQQLLRAHDALRRGGRRNADADPPRPQHPTANPARPVKIPVTYRRPSAPESRAGLWAGPVRRHR